MVRNASTTCAASSDDAGRPLDVRISGIVPRIGSPSPADTWSGKRNRWSNRSMRKANPRPSPRPAASPSRMMLGALFRLGWGGATARAPMRTPGGARGRAGAGVGKAGLRAAGVEGAVEHVGLVHLALEPGLVLRSGGELLELAGGDLDALVQLILAELELLYQGLSVERDGLGPERVDLLDQVADLLLLVGVPRSQGAQLGLRRGELIQNPLEVGRLPDGVDGVEGVDGHLPPLAAVQDLLDVTAVAPDRVQAAALREVGGVHGRLGEQQPRGDRRFLSRQRHRSHAEPFQPLLGRLQAVGLAHDLGVENLRQQGQLLALLGGRLVDIALDERVEYRGRRAGALVAQPEDEEVVFPQRGLQSLGEIDRGLSRRHDLEPQFLVAAARTDLRGR